MIVKDIWQEVIEVTGSSNDALNYRTLTRAVQLLGNKGLFDPMLGTLDFNVSGGYLVALPRDVKTPLRININENPSFSRSRLFEFSQNSDGSVDGPEVGWSWHQRGFTAVQDERPLPSTLKYSVNVVDEGKTITLYGFDVNGKEVIEQLVGSATAPTESENTFAKVERIIRDATTLATTLVTPGSVAVGQFYPNETEPQYRVIKIASTGVAIRMLYRKHAPIAFTSQNDLIPLSSHFAVIRAVSAVSLMQRQRYEEAEVELVNAVKFETEEQQSRDESSTVSEAVEIATATNTNISTNNVLIVGDIYDVACDIFGAIGRKKIFDRITDAINTLGNKAAWDSMMGNVDIWKPDTNQIRTADGNLGSGIFVLPREVGSVYAVNVLGAPRIPRNRWFEYHINGTGETDKASPGTWDDAGDTPIIGALYRNDDGSPKDQTLCATCEDGNDNGKTIRVYGYNAAGDWLKDENGADGIVVEAAALDDITPSSQSIARITRVSKEATSSFIRLWTVKDGSNDRLLGYYYPDETEPMYRAIKLDTAGAHRIRVRFRKRTEKVSSLHDIIFLRSRIAVEVMMRAIRALGEDPKAASAFEMIAANYIAEEQAQSNPIKAVGLAFDEGTCPALTDNFS